MKLTHKNTLFGLIFSMMVVIFSGEAVVADEKDNMTRLAHEVDRLADASREFSKKIRIEIIDVAANTDFVAFLKKSSRSEGDIQNFSEKLIGVTATYSDMLNISLLDEQGVVIASSLKDRIGDSELKKEFPEGFAGKPFLASPFLGSRGEGMTLGFAPVRDADKVYGTVVCAFFLPYFEVEHLKEEDIGVPFVLNNEGQVVWRIDPPNLLYRKWSDAELDLYKEIVAAGDGYIDAVDSQGVSSRFQFKTDELLKMTIGIQAKK